MKTIAAVPEFITREEYLGLMTAIGLKVHLVRSLEFRTDGIYAEVFETNAEGHKVLDAAKSECVMNRIYIPVIG